MNRVELGPDIPASIRAHGVETYPHECCGALVGRPARSAADHQGDGGELELTVIGIVPLPNTTEEGPRRRFLVRPVDYRAAERRARELGGELVGFYHSHPDHPARPSQYDLDHAWPTFAYVIVSVLGDGHASIDGVRAADMTVWFLADDRSAFSEGSLSDGNHDPDPDTAPAIHGQA